MTDRPTFWGNNLRDFAPELAGAAVALLLRLWFVVGFSTSPLFTPLEGGHDRTLYLTAATSVAEGQLLPPGSFEYLPLYPWMLGLVFAVFSPSPLTAAILGLICDTLTVFLLIHLARRLGARPGPALAVGLIYAAYPLAIIYSALTMPNTLNALGLTVFALLAASSKPFTLRRGVLLGLVAGVLALGFAGILLISVVVLGAFVIRDRVAALPGVAAFLVAMVLPLLVPAIHNTKAEGQFVLLTTHGGFNLYMGNHEHATGYPLRIENFRMTARAMLDDAHRFAEASMGRDLSRAESSVWWSDRARDFQRDHPGPALRLTIKKIMLFWNHLDMDDLRMREQIGLIDQRFTAWGWPAFSVISLLGLLGLIYARGVTGTKLMVIAGMIGLALFFITARYRLTFAPILCALGAVGLTQLLDDLRSRTIRPRLFALPLLGLVFWPFEVRDQRPVDHYNAAIQLIAADRFDQALDIIQRGLAIDPAFANLYHAEGSVWFRQEKYDAAAEAFARADQFNSTQLNTRYNLALSLARAERYCEAYAALDRDPERLQQDPTAARLHAELRAICEASR